MAFLLYQIILHTNSILLKIVEIRVFYSLWLSKINRSRKYYDVRFYIILKSLLPIIKMQYFNQDLLYHTYLLWIDKYISDKWVRSTAVKSKITYIYFRSEYIVQTIRLSSVVHYYTILLFLRNIEDKLIFIGYGFIVIFIVLIFPVHHSLVSVICHKSQKL